jgi:hypothetical protein
MSIQHARPFSRRRFLRGVTLAGTVGLTGLYPGPSAAEPPPETTRLTFFQLPGICTAPVAVAEALLRAEGFREVRYVPAISGVDSSRKLAAGEADFSSWRDFDPEDSLRFYALRLHEAKMIKSTPQKLITQGTDWRFLNELKKELKT